MNEKFKDRKARKRTEAEARNEAYQRLSVAEKLKTAGARVKAKIEIQQKEGIEK